MKPCAKEATEQNSREVGNYRPRLKFHCDIVGCCIQNKESKTSHDLLHITMVRLQSKSHRTCIMKM